METEASGARTRLRLLTDATRRLDAAGVDHPRRNAEWLLADVLNCTRAQLYAYADAEVAPEEARRFADIVARRRTREPLQYIIGHTDFYGLQLAVTPDVLIPRPETEELVEHVLGRLDAAEAPRVLDVGTGSGCIALALKDARPDAAVQACDISAAALQVATTNAEELGLQVAFYKTDVLSKDFSAVFAEPFDMIVSNPPYVPDAEFEALAPEVRAHEPREALLSGDDPLRFYRALARHQGQLLTPEGQLIVETHADYTEEVASLFADAGLIRVQVHRDVSGRARIVEAHVPPA